MSFTINKITMEINFNVVYKLRYHHLDLGLSSFQPRISICLDNMLSAPTYEIILKCNDSGSLGNFNDITQSELREFKGGVKDVNLSNIIIPQGNFYTRRYKVKSKYEYPKDSTLLIYAYATHMNSNDIPCQVCVGCCSVHVYDVYRSLRKKKGSTTIHLRLKNREHEVGNIALKFKSINLPPSGRWLDCNVYSKDEINRVAVNHAKREYMWIEGFDKPWAGISGMMDLFGFMMMGRTIPISFFLQRDREMTENEFKVLLYFALRRYSIEHNLNFKKIKTIFTNLPIVEKCSILGTMLTLVTTSYVYNTDYYIKKNGNRKLVETFQAPSKTGSGDCDDFADDIESYVETMLFLDDVKEAFKKLKNVQDPILRELMVIQRMYTSAIILCRTTTANLGMSASDANRARKRDLKMKFKSFIEKKMFECQGRNRRCAAHMSCKQEPTDLFWERIRPDLNPNFDGDDPEYLKVRKNEKLESDRAAKYYRKHYDDNLKTDDLPVIVLEGTGEFNSVNQNDPAPILRERLLNANSGLSSSKYKIYHPTGDPKQFYLNMISMLIPRFIKKYEFPMSTFVLAYEMDNGKPVYGVTYKDFIEKRNYSIIPKDLLTEKEMDIVYQSCKTTIRQSVMKIKDDLVLDSYEKIASNVDDINEAFTMYNLSSIKTNIRGNDDDLRNYTMAINKIGETCIKVNRGLDLGKIKGDDIRLYFSFQPYVVNESGFHKRLEKGMTKPKLRVVNLDYFSEIIGENVKNIVLVVTMRK